MQGADSNPLQASDIEDALSTASQQPRQQGGGMRATRGTGNVIRIEREEDAQNRQAAMELERVAQQSASQQFRNNFDRAVADNTVDFNSNNDVKVKGPKQPADGWRNAYQRVLQSNIINGATRDQISKMLLNSQARPARQIRDATLDNAREYLETHSAKLTQGLKNVLSKLFAANPGQDVNGDLTTAVLRGFYQYARQGSEAWKTAISLQRMYRPGTNPSGYDRLVILKAKRIVKLLKSCISSYGMKSDISLSKLYQQTRGYYNQNKLRQLPEARAQYAKRIIQKVGSLDKAEYDRSLNAGQQAAVNYMNSAFDRYRLVNPRTIVAQQQNQNQAALYRDAYKQMLRPRQLSEQQQALIRAIQQ